MAGSGHLDWDGCFNVRDLGGLPAADGSVTRRGALVRADALDRLTAEGWRTLAAHGVRTVIDLRGEDEQRAAGRAAAAGVATLHVPLGRSRTREFRERWGDDPVVRDAALLPRRTSTASPGRSWRR